MVEGTVGGIGGGMGGKGFVEMESRIVPYSLFGKS